MEKAFIFHGTGASRDDHWFPWLERKLQEEGIEVCRPEFPTPEDQKLENWLEVLDSQEMKIDENTVLICHSLAAVFILNLLNRRDLDVEGAYLVSAWTGLLPDEQFNDWNSTFQDQDFDFEKIRDSVGQIHQFHSEDDPYVPIEMAEVLSENISSDIHVKQGSGPFNTQSGYESFSELWELIEKEI